MSGQRSLKHFAFVFTVHLQAVVGSDPYVLPPLGFPYEALEGKFVGAETMHLHHDKHHALYVNKLNAAIRKGGIDAPSDIGQLLAKLGQVPPGVRAMVRNHGGGHFNHMQFWEWLTPQPGGSKLLAGPLADKINEHFGSLEGMQKEFSDAAALLFGSGWTWLIAGSDGKLRVCTTANQDNPVMDESVVNLEGCHGFPIFGLDVWEHAYYLDHKNVRPNYIKAFWKVLNWEEVQNRYLKQQSLRRQKSNGAVSLGPDGPVSARSDATFASMTLGVFFTLFMQFQF